MNKNDDRTVAAIVIIWLFGLLLSLAFWGVVIWGIVELISWLVTK